MILEQLFASWMPPIYLMKLSMPKPPRKERWAGPRARSPSLQIMAQGRAPPRRRTSLALSLAFLS
jgi:hypothetical protein